MNSWGFQSQWNLALETGREDRKVEPRARIWASELGGSMVDRYLKLKGVKPSTPPDSRALRKFEAGNLMEWVVGLVLKRSGIMQETQEHIEFAYPNCLPVTGRLDFLAGGEVDWEKAQDELKELGLPEFFGRATSKIVEHLKTTYPDGLKPMVLEVKSVSSMMYDRYERYGKANDNHELQAFHYLKGKGMDEGHIIYICKDDLRLLEIPVFNPSDVESKYKTDIETLSQYYFNDEMPPKEQPIIWDDRATKFSANWKVKYSNYLSYLYGMDHQSVYEERYEKQIAQWNRVLTRIIQNKDMTPANKTIISDMRTMFNNLDQLISQARGNRGFEVEE